MKIRKYIIALTILLSTSCADWLNVIPTNEVVEEDMYAEATGYHNVLNGLYKNMAKPSHYGASLTFGMVDALGDVYNSERVDSFYGEGLSSYSPLYRISLYSYTYNAEVISMIDNTWESGYNVIINANSLINSIKEADNSIFRFGEEEKNLILGEALAIRALCHFDIARLFAPSFTVDGGEELIHYNTESDINSPNFTTNAQSTEEIFKLIEADLLMANEYISAYDTLTPDRQRLLSTDYRFSPTTGMDAVDLFYQYRGYRVNAIAVNALLARMYNYWGKHDLAAHYANIVINYTYTSNDTEYSALSFSSGWSVSKDRKFEEGLIFALSYPKLMTDYQSYLVGNSVLTLKHYEDLFLDYEYADGGDYRSKNLIEVADSWYEEAYPLKNIPHPDDDDIIDRAADMVPMIRLSEMYFILADYYAANGNFGMAEDAINTVREGRNCSSASFNISDMEEYKEVYLNEFHREFFQEGQIFYQHKKYNDLITKRMTEENFVLPLPESQSI